jgi:hypothetical protein
MVKVEAKADDFLFTERESFAFVQDLLDKRLEEIIQKIKDENLVTGFTDEELKEWIFDYVYNCSGEYDFWDYLNNHGVNVCK